jgi:hypothetical protein
MHTARLVDFISTPDLNGITPSDKLNVNADVIRNALDNPSSNQKDLALRNLTILDDHMKTQEDKVHNLNIRYDPKYLGKPSPEIIRDINTVQDKQVTTLGKQLADLVTRTNPRF